MDMSKEQAKDQSAAKPVQNPAPAADAVRPGPEDPNSKEKISKLPSTLRCAKQNASLIIACLALGLTVWSAYETRRHHRLSVEPRLTFKTPVETTGPTIGIYLSNKGFGPAIVREFRFFIDGKRVEPDGQGGWKQALSKLGFDESQYWIESHPVKPGDPISSGVTICLLGFSHDYVFQGTDDKLLRFTNAVSRIKFQIVYQSVYAVQNTAEYP